MPAAPSISALDSIFRPRSVAVVGASERGGSVGRALMENLGSFQGNVWAVNPKHETILGRPCVANLREIGEPLDLVVIAAPAAGAPGIIGDCVAANVPGAVIISAGFRECGPEGAALERQVMAAARQNGLRIIGPNCLGVMRPESGLNATFATAMARPGRVAFLSQSGALCTAILDWSLREHVGFSAFVSVGSMLDVGWGDLIRYFGEDEATSSIVVYMESVGDAQAFLCAARDVAARKPIVVIKVGRTEAAARAAASHTGALTGSDAVLDAALRQVGVLRVSTIEELFDTAEVLAKQPLPQGPRLCMVTNAGGPGALATDALVGAGGEVAVLSAETHAALNALLPPHWSRSNPVDVLGDADAGRFARALEIVARDPGVDGLLTILTPQAMTQPTAVAQALLPVARGLAKPVLSSWMGAGGVEGGREVLNEGNIPTYDYPDEGARAFVFMWQRKARLELLAEGTRLVERYAIPAAPDGVEAWLQNTHKAGRRLLTEAESKAVLSAAGIPVVETLLASSEDEAVALADGIGYPVVAKLNSLTLTHKSDVGGVKVGLASADAVRRAWRSVRDAVRAKAGEEHFQGMSIQRMVLWKGQELIVGASVDAQFGPVLLFGAGGILVEVFKDRALTLPPVDRTLARRWIDETRIATALKGVRGARPVDLDALADTLVRFSDLVLSCPDIQEIDINPLLASPDGIVALDARILLRPPGKDRAQIPPPAMLTCG